MNDHLCQFCKQITVHAPLDVFADHGIDINFCHVCSAEYIFYRNGDLSHYSLYTTINDKMYRWTLNETGFHKFAWLRWVQNPGVPGVYANKDMIPIKKFQGDIPDITPQNINEKIRTYLVFL